MVKTIKKLFIEEEFADKNAEREIIARLYFSDCCDLEDIEEMTGYLISYREQTDSEYTEEMAGYLMAQIEADSEDVSEMVRDEKALILTKIEYKTEECVKIEAKLAKKRRETGNLLGLLYRCCPGLKGCTLKQSAFIHSALDKIIKLRNACWGKKQSTEADAELFIEEGFKGKNAEREIIARLYSGGECDLEDISRVTNFTVPYKRSQRVFDSNGMHKEEESETTYATVGNVSFETALAREGRQTNILMNLIERCYPELRRRNFEQLSFIHSVLDRIIKLNKSCRGEDWKLETAQEL
jgi:hypothetical protein